MQTRVEKKVRVKVTAAESQSSFDNDLFIVVVEVWQSKMDTDSTQNQTH